MAKKSGLKNKFAKTPKLSLSFLNEKPIVKNGYLMALLVFVALVVAFNVADSYSKNDSNQITGLAITDSLTKITDLLKTFTDFVFKDLLKDTVLGAFLLHNDVIIRLIIFIALLTIISLFKLPKTISVIIALVTAVFVPEEVIGSIFSAGGLFSGMLGFIIWTAFIFLPLFGLFKWLGHTQSKLTSLFLGFMFLGWLFVITAVEGNVLVTPYFTDLWDILIAFGSFACFVGFIWGAGKGFTTGAKSIREEGNKALETFIDEGGVKGEWDRTKKHFGGLWGKSGTPKTKDNREALVKLERLASIYYRKAIRNSSVVGQNKLEEKFVQQAGKLGVGKSQAKKILWKR